MQQRRGKWRSAAAAAVAVVGGEEVAADSKEDRRGEKEATERGDELEGRSDRGGVVGLTGG
uniref:Uncharacterized protein n=1 Tax=Oryza sativa subsp. japonica TaxID=39947 RepID=Q84Q29_ORYSJ|nr:hypothetical protein [Oryza sativa Japonica Group]